MRNLAPVSLALTMFVAACSSSSTTTKEQDKGLAGDDQASLAPDTNPDGKPYPTDNIGTKPSTHKSSGAVGERGQRLANYKFLGYPNGDTSQGLKPVSMANFYDPDGKKFKLIHIQAAGVWCTYCRQEMDQKKQVADALMNEGVALITTLAEGAKGGDPAVQSDLDGWVNRYKPNYAQLLDPGNKNLGVFYDAAALPWNAYVDARTMEILDYGVGLETPTAADMQKKAEAWLRFLEKNSAAVK